MDETRRDYETLFYGLLIWLAGAFIGAVFLAMAFLILWGVL
jgi:hypothetical protein